MKRLSVVLLCFCLLISNTYAIKRFYSDNQIDPLTEKYSGKQNEVGRVNTRMQWITTEKGNYCLNENGEAIFDEPSLLIIDVSKWQEKIDWEVVKDQIDGAIIRIGYGAEHEDEYYQYNIEECNRLGIPYGVYLYSFAADEEYAKLEAQNVDRLLSQIDFKPTLPIYYDIEEFKSYTNEEGQLISAPATIEQYENIITSFIEEMNKLGYEGMVNVYSYQWYLLNRLNSEKIRPYVTWYANYSALSITYDNEEYVSSMGWQYTSSATMDGITTRVDVSCFPNYILGEIDHITSIRFNSDIIRGEIGESFDLQVKIYPQSCQEEELYYESEDVNVAIVQDGKVVIVGVGTTFIHARSANGKEAVCQVVTNQHASDVFTVDTISLQEDSTYDLFYQLFPEESVDEVQLEVEDELIANIEGTTIYGKAIGNTNLILRCGQVEKRIPITVTSCLPFVDVEATKWYYPYIKEVYQKQIMTGTSASYFQPSKEITRGMLITILYRLANNPRIEDYGYFSDVDQNKYYAKAISWAKENGIIEGYSDGTFRPSNAITRQDFAVILYRYTNRVYENDTDIIESYPDQDQVSNYARDAMNWAVTNGLISGTNGKLDPKGYATRGQAAKMILATYNLLNR